jgi:type VI secretion system secreted protein VgrG
MPLNHSLSTLKGLTQSNRPIRLRVSTEHGVADDLLMVKHVSGVETVCGGIEYRLLCLSTEAGLPLKHFNAAPVELQFVTDTGGLRSVCGIVAQSIEGESDGGLASYQLIVRDALAIMEKRLNTRIFRNASEADITGIVLREWQQENPVLARAFDFVLRHVKSYPAREFTMQYNESDAAFLRRLWKRRGLSWFFQPGKASKTGSDSMPAHALVLFDDTATLEQNAAGAVRYHRDDGTEARDSITAWHAVRTLTPGRITRQCWDYAQGWSLGSQVSGLSDQGSLGNQLAVSLEDYVVDVPHAGHDADDYRSLGTLRMQRHEYESKYFHAESGVRDLCVGQWIGVSGHAEIDTHPPGEREFVVTELRVDAENNLPKALNDRSRRLFALNRWGGVDGDLERASAERGARYTNQFTCVRRGIPIVPAYDPRMDLSRTEAQSVIVVGPVGEEVHCDEHGRVKVRFPACRKENHEHAHGAGASDSDRDSAWVRVASSWAGELCGAISLPRAGDECLVTFLGGDPDKLVITGRVHGGKTPPPNFSHTGNLPGNRFVSGIKSREVNGRRYNQLRLDDTPGQISAQLASEQGHSQLNLGYLTHPRSDGKGEVRGNGAELRSDQAVAIRGGRGVYISADARLRAAGHQLARDGLIGLSEAIKGIQKQLAELAEIHHADDTDSKPLSELAERLKQWENGSNTETGTSGAAGGEPIVAIDAPAGMLVGSGANIVIGAQTHIDIVSVGNTQVSAGRKLLVRATEGISLFAHKLGMKLIAASGKVEIQAHQENIELTSAKRIVLSASDEIVIQAPKVSIITQGAQAAYGGGAITYQLSGAYAINSATFAHRGQGDSQVAPPTLPKSAASYDQRVRIADLNTGVPIANQCSPQAIQAIKRCPCTLPNINLGVRSSREFFDKPAMNTKTATRMTLRCTLRSTV